ncbi:MAG: glycosyltransferase family 2 protein [bacterium]|nr:glycosyltransferase family 2 protein [bacterium]
MIEGKTIAVVIPCHNEEAGLRRLLQRLPAEIDEIVIVDNNSTDQTASVARTFGARVITEKKPGYGWAYQAGLSAATVEIIATLDGDAQYPVEEVPRLVRAFLDRRLDFLSGCRFPLRSRAMPFTRRLGNMLLTTAAYILFGVRIRDTQSGMWVFHRTLYFAIQPREPGMAFSEEFKIKVIRAGLRFGEEHISYYPRVGASKLLPLRDGWDNLVYLVRLRFTRSQNILSRNQPAAS